jgi:glycosyltransferase involved in cell wall biosynthesis
VRITLINTLYRPEKVVGGAERSVELLAQWLSAKHQVSVISLHPGKDILEKKLAGVDVTYIGLQNQYWPFDGKKKTKSDKMLWHLIDTWNLPMARQVTAILEKQRPDLVHTNNLAGFSCAVWPSIKQLKIPIVHTLRDYYLLCTKSSLFKNNKLCAKRCMQCKLHTLPRRFSSLNINAVVGNSRYILDMHLNKGYFSNIRFASVIHNGYQSPLSKQESSTLSNESFRIGFIGRVAPYKGIEVLLSSLQRLQNKNWQLLVGGECDSSYLQYLLDKFRLDNIHFLGVVNPSEFFSKINVLVVPSVWPDPLPRVIFEAYAYGIPVIVSNRGGSPEIVDAGATGLVFDPDKPDELTKIINMLIDDSALLDTMRLQALEKARQFAPNNISNSYLSAYNDLLNSKDGESKK